MGSTPTFPINFIKEKQMIITDEQREIIRAVALQLSYETALEHPNYLATIVSDWIDSKNDCQCLAVISDDPKIVEEMLGFNPYS